jgi:hypothetical protein
MANAAKLFKDCRFPPQRSSILRSKSLGNEKKILQTLETVARQHAHSHMSMSYEITDGFSKAANPCFSAN